MTCSDKSCADVITAANDADCKTYSSTCYFVATNSCATLGACSSYAKTSATDCNALKDTAGNVCGFKTGASSCSAKSCADVITAADDAACKTYLSTCYFVATNSCAALGACSSYAKTSATDCNALKDTAGKVCGFKTGASSCSDKSCTDVLVAADDAACATYLSTCKFSTTNACVNKTCGDLTTAANDAACKTYLPTCYLSGTNACSTILACSGYTKTSATDCNALKDTSGTACGFKTGASACSDKTCADVVTVTDDAGCKTYLSSCYFVTSNSCATLGACTSYTKTSATDCNALKDTAGNVCGFKTGASTCSDKSCTDVLVAADNAACATYLSTCKFVSSNLCANKTCNDTVASPSIANCSAYLSTCLFDGTKCYAPAACNTYVATGAANSDKATYCNSLNGPTSATKCTYKSGDTNCSDATTCA